MEMPQLRASSRAAVAEAEALRLGRGACGAALLRRVLQPKTRLGLWIVGRGTAQRWSCEAVAIGEGGATRPRPSPPRLAGRGAFAARVGLLLLDTFPSPSPLLALCAAAPRRALPRQPPPPS